MKVSVLVITYNHERFIRQALHGVLQQQTDFEFEIIITEDCSTDDTRNIIQSIQQQHPDRIRLLLSARNQNDNEVLSRGIEAARGDYIALLDGDDYWTSRDKLQKQVDFLDAHPDCAVCFHNVTVVYDDDSPEHPFHQEKPVHHHSAPKPKPVSTLGDVVKHNFMQTCSVVFRRGLFDRFPPWYRDFPLGDWPLHVLNAEHGDIGYIDEILSAYRVHAGGFWSMNMSRYSSFEDVNGIIQAYHTIDRHLNFRFNRSIRPKLPYLYYRAAQVLLDARRHKKARRHVWKGMTYAAPRFCARDWDALKLALRSYLRQPRD